MGIQYYTYPERYPDLLEFLNSYAALSVIYCPDEKMVIKDPSPDNLRRCRFCGKDDLATSFCNDSHLIPAFLGNRYLLFHNECDSCNALVSKFETHFSAYLGPAMTMTSTKGRKKKVPKFRAADKKISMEPEEVFGKKGIMLADNFPSGFDIDVKTGKAEIPFLKETYIPIMVYKCLLKMAFALLPQDRLEQYPYFRALLLTDKIDGYLGDWAKVLESWNTVPSSIPRVYLFEKLDKQTAMCSHVFVLYVKHQVFQIVLPHNVLDRKVIGDKLISQLYSPPLFQQEVKGSPLYQVLKDLSSTEKCREEGVVRFEFDPQHLNNLHSRNIKTGETKAAVLKPDEIVKLFISNDLT